jgi:hypothetical protein
VFRGGPIELEQLDSTDPTLAVHAFTLAVIVNIVAAAQKKYMTLLGLWAVLPFGLLFFTAFLYHSVPVRAAVCHRVNGRLTALPDAAFRRCPVFWQGPGKYMGHGTSIRTLWNNQSRWKTRRIPEECLVPTPRH